MRWLPNIGDDAAELRFPFPCVGYFRYLDFSSEAPLNVRFFGFFDEATDTDSEDATY